MNLLELALEVLSKAPQHRSPADLQLIVNATKDIKFFQQLSQSSSSLHEQCCKLMTLQSFPIRHFIVHIGGIGDAFFVVLKGTLAVLLFKKHKAEE